MGVFRFRFPDRWRLTSRQATTIHIIGIDGIPHPVRVSSEESEAVIVIRRNRDESGKLYIAYPFPEYGELTVCTGSLPERDEPYLLMIELARGNLNRLRTQISVWQEGGLKIPDELKAATHEATDLLGEAILCEQGEQQDELAIRSLHASMDLVFQLSRIFGEQVCDFRVNHPDFAKFQIGFSAGLPGKVDPGTVSEFCQRDCFENVQLHPTWFRPGEREQAVLNCVDASGLPVIVGPLVDTGPGGMETSLIDLDDFAARRSRIIAGCRSVLSALPENASMIHVACGLNGTGHRHMSYPQQLQLTGDLLALIEDCACEIPNLLSFDFPWAERLASSVGGIHPLQIADTLLRQGLRISYLGMDINLDYWPGGSVLRDPLQWIDAIDVWSQLGLPLILCLRIPGGVNASSEDTDHSNGSGRDRKLVYKCRSNLSDEQRLGLLRDVLPVVFARPTVHGLLLRQMTDMEDERFPGAGVTWIDGHAKPVVDLVVETAAKFLRPRS